MNNLNLIEQLLENIDDTPLSKSVARMLPVALECRDYEGYCILSYLIHPITQNTSTNGMYTTEIMKTLILQGLSKEEIINLIEESKEKYLDIKTISPDKVSSHSLKEIEELVPGAKKILESPAGLSVDAYKGLSFSIDQISRMYESMRGYVLSKLLHYHQVLKIINDKKIEKEKKLVPTSNFDTTKIFIVHGHNGEIKEALARVIENQGLQAIILHEQANQGKTIIEKFERNSDVGCAVCLFTADDVGNAKDASEQQARARQNVVFEAGYFIGKIGRERVILLADKDVEIPSDLQGVLYIGTGDWRFSILKELKKLGYSIDYDKL